MEKKRLFNWEIEKKVKELESQLQFKEVSLEELENFIIEHNYYNGENVEVYVLLCNTYYSRGYFDKADEVFHKLFDIWKVQSNKFPQNIQKLRHHVDLIISNVRYVPKLMIEFLKKQKPQELDAITSYAIERYVNYERTNLLDEFLEKIPYEGKDPNTLFNLINASLELDKTKVDAYVNRALAVMKDPISFLNNIKFTEGLFEAITPDTLKKILDLPGINTKFHHFINFKSFMEALDKIPTLQAKFFIDISNRLYEKNTAMAIQYGKKAVARADFSIEDHLGDMVCACEKDPPEEPSANEILMLSALKGGKFPRLWAVVEKSYLPNAKMVAHWDEALKYTAAAVKLSGAKSDLIAKHIMFLSRRMRSVDGPEGILEGDRYKHKEENAKFNQQIEGYRTLYQKKTGKKFLI